MTKPAPMLIMVMMMPAMASPRTNLEAPSMAPWKLASPEISSRRLRAVCSSMRPALRSASMAICLPGMASRVKRAATSAMRPAPLVMTMKLMITRMTKMTMPTTYEPPTTNWPKAWMTEPAASMPSLPCSRMSRVEATLSDSRNRVVASRSDGKMEKSIARSVYRLMMRMSTAMVMLAARQRSSSMAGRGMIISMRMEISPSEATMSLRPSRSAGRIRPKNVCAPVAAIYRLVVRNE